MTTKEGASADLLVLHGLQEAVRVTGHDIGWAVALAIDVADEAGQPLPAGLPRTLRVLGRFIDFGGGSLRGHESWVDNWPPRGTPWPALPGDYDASIATWQRWLSARIASGVRRQPPDAAIVARAWQLCESRLQEFANSGLPGRAQLRAAPAAMEDLVLAAADLMPSRVMRRDIGEMDAFDWSELVLAGFTTAGGAGTTSVAHPVAVIEGLRRLRIGTDEEIRGLQNEAGIKVTLDQLRKSSRPAFTRAGILAIVPDDARLDLNDPRPYVHVRASRRALYDDAIKWLIAAGALKGGIREE